ncbi:hypothetical protein, partial [Actinomadura welshii]|uniref:hypothetical protein n=1 Tax=Actinomadura welshii TaxID=3103817 RepID=UPI001F2A4873
LRGVFRAVELFHQIRPDCQNEPFPTQHNTADTARPRRLIEWWFPRCPAGRHVGVLHPCGDEGLTYVIDAPSSTRRRFGVTWQDLRV